MNSQICAAFACLDQLWLGRARACVQQVGPDTVMEQVWFLRDDADGLMQRFQGQVANVMAVNPDCSRSRVVKARTRRVIVVLPAPDDPTTGVSWPTTA